MQYDHRPASGNGGRHEKEDDAQQARYGHGPDVGHPLTDAQRDGYGQYDPEHVGDFADGEERSAGEYHTAAQQVVLPDEILEVISFRPAADRVEEQRGHRHAQQYPPRPVAGERFHVGQNRLSARRRAFDRGDAFARQAEAEQEKQRADCPDDDHGRLPSVGLRGDGPRGVHVPGVGGEEVAQGFENRQCQEAAPVGEKHPVGGEYRPFARIVGHHAQHRPIGDVDGGVDGHHQQVGGVGPYQFGRIAPRGCRKGEDAGHGERNGDPEQVRSVTSPAGGRTVGDQAHDGIGYRVPEFGDEQQYGGMFQAQPENVGVEKRKIIGEYFPEHARRHVAQPVPDFFRPCSCHFSV